MQIISEEIGKRVFERQMIAANKAYEKPEETVPSIYNGGWFSSKHKN